MIGRFVGGPGRDQKAGRFGIAVLEGLVKQGRFQRVIVGICPPRQKAFHFLGLTTADGIAQARGRIEEHLQEHISLLSPHIRRRALRGQSPVKMIKR